MNPDDFLTSETRLALNSLINTYICYNVKFVHNESDIRLYCVAPTWLWCDRCERRTKPHNKLITKFILSEFCIFLWNNQTGPALESRV